MIQLVSYHFLSLEDITFFFIRFLSFPIIEEYFLYHCDLTRFLSFPIIGEYYFLNHCDLILSLQQPENILCDGEGRVVLADFGFSKFTGKGNKMGEICGTVGYAGMCMSMNVYECYACVYIYMCVCVCVSMCEILSLNMYLYV